MGGKGKRRNLKDSHKSSYEVFMGLMRVHENGTYDPSRLISQEGYGLWLKSRKGKPKRPADSFRRALTAHVRATDGRKPFPPKVEEAILQMLRTIGGKKEDGSYRCWPCFKGTKRRIGMLGPQALGFHEAKRKLKQENKLDDKELQEFMRNTNFNAVQSDSDDSLSDLDRLGTLEPYPWPRESYEDFTKDMSRASVAL